MQQSPFYTAPGGDMPGTAAPELFSTMRSLVVLVGPSGAGKRTFIKSINRQPDSQSSSHETLRRLNCGCRYVKNPSEEKRFFSLAEMPFPIPRKDAYDHPARYWHVFAAWTQNNPSSRWPVRAKGSATPLLSTTTGVLRSSRLPVEEYEEVRELPFQDRERLVVYSRDWDVFAFRAFDFFSDVSKLAFMSELWVWNAVQATELHQESLAKPRHNFHFPSAATRRFAQQQQQSSSRDKLLADKTSSQSSIVDPSTKYFLDAFVEDCIGKAPRCYMYMHPAEQPFVPEKVAETLEHYLADPRGVRSSVFIVLNTRMRYLYQCKTQPAGQDAARMAENRRLAIGMCYQSSYKYAEVDALDPESVERLLAFVASSELKFVYHQRLAIRAARPMEARTASQNAVTQMNAVAAADRVVEAMFVADRIPVQVQVCEIRDDSDYVACDPAVRRALDEGSSNKRDAVLSGVGYLPTLAPIPNDREPPTQPRVGDTTGTVSSKDNRLELQMNLWGEHCVGGGSTASPNQSQCNIL